MLDVITHRQALCTLVFAVTYASSATTAADLPAVTAPPKNLKANAFYSKYIDANGYPILASSQVNDYALREGKRHAYSRIEPGELHQQPTYVGHSWVIADASGKELGHFVADKKPGRAVIDNIP